MSGYQRLRAFDLVILVRLLKKNAKKCDRLMRRACAGGLDYGWDWPTCAVYFPRKYATRRAVLAEAKKKLHLA